MAATVPGRNPHTGAAQGALVRHPRGSNGGVHRGPDLQLRINATRGLVLEALAREGILLVIPAKGKKRQHRSKIPMAMLENVITRLQQIVLSGTDANVLRLVSVANEVFRPGPHEKNGHDRAPMPATFVRAPGAPAPPPEEAPDHPPAPATLVDANGQEYVSG